MEPGAPIDLTAHLSHQPDSIVSSTLLDGEGGTVTLFAMDGGQRISEHTAPHDAIAQVLSGELSVRIDDDEVALGAGDAVVLPASVPHAVAADSETTFLLTMVRTES